MRVDPNKVKRAVLQEIAGNRAPMPAGQAKFRIGEQCIHTRYCSESFSSPDKYKFNINPNTLSANYELWICGGPKHYYLMPIVLMQEVYNHPGSYVDRHHPEIRIVSVDVGAHRLTYAAGGESIDLSRYFRAVLPA